MMRLQGKVAIITGAASGIGRAAAELFAKEGAKVALCDLNLDALNDVVAGIAAAGGVATSERTNVSVRAECEALVDNTIARFGKVDILLNNAGVVDLMHGVGNVSDEMWDRMISVNLNGPMYTSRRVVAHMLEAGGGSIVNIASTASLVGSSAGVAYTAAKHGVVGLTRSTAWIYAPKGIRCNAICPGGVQTGIVTEKDVVRWDPEGTARISATHGLIPAILQPLDIASLALFLASDESRFINGTIIPADAGWTVG